MGYLLYFAYDHRMDESVLAATAPGTELFGPSQWPDHELKSVVAAGGSSARLTPQAAARGTVWGVLWMVPAEHLPALDAAHGAPDRAERTTVRIISPAGPPTQAICYRPADAPDWPVLLRAAKRHQLPEAYQSTLAALAAATAKNSR